MENKEQDDRFRRNCAYNFIKQSSQLKGKTQLYAVSEKPTSNRGKTKR